MTQKQDVDRTADSNLKRRGWTKARAVLAGGLVLGVGAAITLAAWTDQEWVSGVFGSGTFGIEGSANGGAFGEHPTDTQAADLSFALGTGEADALTPGDEVYGGFAVQLIAGSDYAADVQVTQDASAAIPGTTASYRYTTTETCDADAYAAGNDENLDEFSLTAVQDPAYLCFRVSAGPTLQPGQSGEIVWQFEATSTDTL
ncbi:SipW-dependent-type signal peptide-containing protein [Leucobacter sp. GX24907]